MYKYFFYWKRWNLCKTFITLVWAQLRYKYFGQNQLIYTPSFPHQPIGDNSTDNRVVATKNFLAKKIRVDRTRHADFSCIFFRFFRWLIILVKNCWSSTKPLPFWNGPPAIFCGLSQVLANTTKKTQKAPKLCGPWLHPPPSFPLTPNAP